MDATDPEFTLEHANDLRRVIGETVRAVRRSEAAPEGQIEVLGFLARDGAQSMAALARLRRVRHQTMRVTVTDLEGKGLVRREPDPDDGRGFLVTLTDEGEAMIAEFRERRARVVRDAAERALTPEERADLVRATIALDKLARALESAPESISSVQ